MLTALIIVQFYGLQISFIMGTFFVVQSILDMSMVILHVGQIVQCFAIHTLDDPLLLGFSSQSLIESNRRLIFFLKKKRNDESG